MARRGHRPEDNVFSLAVHRPEPSPGTGGLVIALMSAPPLAQEFIVHWLRQVAVPCRFTVIDDPGDRSAVPERLDLVVIGHCLHSGPAAGLLDTVRALSDLPAPLVVLAGGEDDSLMAEALRLGVRGYIPTRLPLPVAVAAIKLVLSGGTYAPPQQGLPPASLEAHPAGIARLNLSPRETEVLHLLQLGRSNRQIAAELGISENTVMVHVRHLLRKLGVTNRNQAVYKATRLLAGGG